MCLRSVYVVPHEMSCLADSGFTAGLKSKCLLYFLSRRDEMTRFKCTLKDFDSSATFHTLLPPQKCQKPLINVITNFKDVEKKVLFTSKKLNCNAAICMQTYTVNPTLKLSQRTNYRGADSDTTELKPPFLCYFLTL